jgi:poly(3-hydroxybutyrate) depolymerase
VTRLVGVLWWSMAGVLLLVGMIGLSTAGQGLRSESMRVAGVPVELVRPAGGGTRPAVVVAHGYAGSGRLMRPFADTLARRGYVVALPDLAGHAANTRPFTDIDEAVHDVEAVVRYLRGRADVDPARVALLGHSMGAAAVVRAGATDRRIAATVAISLGDDDAAAMRPGPRNLMLIRGALETGLRSVTELALANTDHGEQVVAPLVEHVGVLYADPTHRSAADWIDDAVGHRPDRPAVEAHRRVAGGAATLFGLLLLLIATAALTRPGQRGAATADRLLPTARGPLAWLGAAVVAGPVVGLVGGLLGTRTLPAAVTGYLVGYFGGVGATLTVAAAVARRGRRGGGMARWTAYAVGLAVTGGAAVLVPVHLGLTSMVPHGAARSGLVAALALATALLLHGAHAVVRLPWAAAILAVAGLPIPVAALVGLAPGFLLVVSPLIAALFTVYLALAAAAHRAGLPAWCAIPAGAVVVAWPIATTLPLT